MTHIDVSGTHVPAPKREPSPWVPRCAAALLASSTVKIMYVCVCAHFPMNIYKSNLLLVQRTNNHLTANPQRGKKAQTCSREGRRAQRREMHECPSPADAAAAAAPIGARPAGPPGTHRCPRWRGGRCSGEHGRSQGHQDTRAAVR